jgi:uncharacterized repeat protein (TIGR01451 family)
VNGSGEVYVTGVTSSTDFPTHNAIQPNFAGGAFDAFVLKLNSAGSALVYSTYLGGSGSEDGRGVAIDSSGNAYIVGHTTSANFPTVNALQTSWHGFNDAFVTKLNASGSALVYSTYLGGGGDDLGVGIAVDSAGSAYVVGTTTSSGFPTQNAIQPSMHSFRDGFVAKVNPSGTSLAYSTYLGGNADDAVVGVTVDRFGNAHVTGWTFSTDFPTKNPLQPSSGGGEDAFVATLNASGSSLIYSTYFGGSGNDTGDSIAVDASGNAYVGGFTTSTDFPTLLPLQAANGGGEDAFVATFSTNGAAVSFSTYLGGSADEECGGLAIDLLGNVYLSGFTGSINFPTASPAQAANGGSFDAFVTKISDIPRPAAADLSVTKSGAPNPVVLGSNLTYTITAGNGGPDTATSVTMFDPLPASVSFISATSTQGNCTQSSGAVSCAIGTLASGANATITIVVTPNQTGTLRNTATVTANESDPNPADNTATASTTVNLPPLYDARGQRADVNAFLSYESPTQATTSLPAGTTSFSVIIFYGSMIDPATFHAALNGLPAAGFVPVPGTLQKVTIPLSAGRNVLTLEVNGTRSDGRTATERDRLTFVVP